MYPMSVAVDGNGDVFIADFGNNRVVEVNAGGTQTTVGSGFNEPRGVAVDGSGDVFIADTGNNRVVEVKSDGTQSHDRLRAQWPRKRGGGRVGRPLHRRHGNSRVVKVTAGVPVTVSPAPTSISVSAAISRSGLRADRDVHRDGHHPQRRPDPDLQRRHGHLLRRHDGAGHRARSRAARRPPR